MQVYNTLTRKKETFKSLEEGIVKMYVCGPTVYDYIHIGNARPNVIFDVVRRYLEYKGYEVRYVQNYTDIDDKIISKAIEEGALSSEIAERFITEAKIDTDALGIKAATHNPKATEEIDIMIDMILTLIEKGFAYEVNGSVYYETRKFEGYGKLSKKNPDDLEAGARIQINDEKQNPMDFVLWKPKKEGEPAWPSPWSEGRPGWHIECSAMAKHYLGDSIDIHAGGEDLAFPHHENEIAQSEAANDKPFSTYWLHNGFINIDNKKMSKSTGNFFTVRDIVKSFDYDVIRFFLVSAHYRSPVNFSEVLMMAAKSSLDRIKTGAKSLERAHEYAKQEALLGTEIELLKQLDSFVGKFEKAMDDDFNTADGVSVIFELIKFSNTYASSDSSTTFIRKIHEKLKILCDILGIVIEEEVSLTDEIEVLIEKRQVARKNKNFALADQIRDELLAKGIILEDTRDGVSYKKG
ncbi:MAG: cysteine--tRNA ligase [Vallitaleaceae bacterium]|jgi:cysteinyl-tRNA synthetase|nr:cysteine--tRNA ligase [Vallitaleaceae bacterium]